MSEETTARALRPHPSKLFVETTTRCTLRCAMCVKQTADRGMAEWDLAPEPFARPLGDPAASSGYDRVVIDTGPTCHALLLLDAAEAYPRKVLRSAGDLPGAPPCTKPRPWRTICSGPVSRRSAGW